MSSRALPRPMRALAVALWSAILLLTGLSLPTRTVAADLRPNVVFLFADDMRSDFIAALGHPEHRAALLLAHRNVQRAVRDDRWKLIRYPQVDVTQLLELQTDPGELVHLVDHPEHADRVRSLRQRLATSQEAFGDRQPWMAEELRPREWHPPPTSR